MKLYLAKPDLTFHAAYNEMMEDWIASGSHIAPWFLMGIMSFEDFAVHVRRLDLASYGIVSEGNSSTTSYFVIDENGRLIGAASLRHYLTPKGLQTWGHIGYGVRPSERRKGYAVQILRMMLEKACEHGLYDVRLGAYADNIGSRKTIEKCGGVLIDQRPDPDHPDRINCRYRIDNLPK